MITRRLLIQTASAAPFVAALPAYAEMKSVVDVTFWDKPEVPMVEGLGYAMGGDMSKATMGFELSTDTVPAGDVTFFGTNASANIEHEMIVSPLPADGAPLPYNEEDKEVDEDAAGAMGEIPETEPGEKGELTLHMQPGKYILYCNIGGHYASGMWALLTVE